MVRGFGEEVRSRVGHPPADDLRVLEVHHLVPGMDLRHAPEAHNGGTKEKGGEEDHLPGGERWGVPGPTPGGIGVLTGFPQRAAETEPAHFGSLASEADCG